jgi:hypothetical protein
MAVTFKDGVILGSFTLHPVTWMAIGIMTDSRRIQQAPILVQQPGLTSPIA